jgi:hypothetical protein
MRRSPDAFSFSINVLAKCSVQEQPHALHQRIAIHLRRIECLPAAERQQPAGEFRSAVRRTHNRRADLPQVGPREKITDFAYRAMHETVVKAKLIAAAFYGAAPKSPTTTDAPPAEGRGSLKPPASRKILTPSPRALRRTPTFTCMPPAWNGRLS